MKLINKLLKVLGLIMILHDEKDIGKIRSDYTGVPLPHHYLTGAFLYGTGVFREEITKAKEANRKAVIGVEEDSTGANAK